VGGEVPGGVAQERMRGTTRALVEAARQLRRELTPAEKALWAALRGRQVGGLRFRCQHAIGPFVADFYCPAAKLIVEVDGPIHDQQVEQDAARTDYLNALGYRVLRLRNEDVLTNLSAAIARIEHATIAVPSVKRHRKPAPEATCLPQTSQPPPT
jgi:very-short-patch-repair endonuclease